MVKKENSGLEQKTFPLRNTQINKLSVLHLCFCIPNVDLEAKIYLNLSFTIFIFYNFLEMAKHIFYSVLFLVISVLAVSCGDDDATPDDDHHSDLAYKVHIHSPSTDDKNVGDMIHIHTDFESESGEAVHHIKVRIYNAVDNSIEIYNQPDVAHVHETDGMLEFHDDFMLTNANGVDAHTDWILEAKVWGHEAEEGEVIQTIQFHVHP